MLFTGITWHRTLLIILFCASQLEHFGQAGLANGDVIPNLPIGKIINNSAAVASLKELRGKIVVVDFFGTWCAPCIRSMPHLQELQNRYNEELTVLLVSNETQSQLEKFSRTKKQFSLAIVVDEENKWNDYFQPAALPYTVVIDRVGKLIATTEAEQINDAMIQQWLTATPETEVNQTQSNRAVPKQQSMNARQESSNQLVRYAQQYIYAAKTGEETSNLKDVLARIPYADLNRLLTTDDLKKAFWINVYNAFTQDELQENASAYKNRKSFFTKKHIKVAGVLFSLDDIEHGILRRSKLKWSLGYISKLFPSRIEKELRVEAVDYRIHFALNCGAKSCPPIAFYNDEILDKQLDLATKGYLASEATYDPQKGEVMLPKLMSWFRADFGGRKGILKMLQQHQVLPAGASPEMRFKQYDWDLSLNNYSNQNNE